MKRVVNFFILLAVAFSSVSLAAPSQAQTPQPPPEVAQAFNSMTPEERVGQLFLATFTGTDASETSQVYDLIARRHVGGVVLLSSNDNFAAAPDTVTQVHALINQLQQVKYEATVTPVFDPATNERIESTYVPLFIGLAQEGYTSPVDQILNGLSPLPSEMAIGATWRPDLAEQVGELQGRELAALGFNLLMGPSLDVLASPNPKATGDMGTLAFGGDPYWVGEMGRAYIAGLHSGSSNRLLVVAKHFPGSGGSDRLLDDEVATVRKSLEQLKQIELYPFFAVTGAAASPDATADGLLVSHIRYQGFQGNIRATTRPVSFDAQALTDILALPQFAGWRDNGGVMVSDDLGTRAVRDFYMQGDASFSARFAARDAFLAGNDLLYLGKIVSSDSENTYDTTLKTLDFFARKYREDSAFAKAVDIAVLRILNKKFRLYGSFSFTKVQSPANSMDALGASQDIAFEVARNSATLVSPSLQDLATVFPSPPQGKDRLVFITDTSSSKQCSSCLEQPFLPADALQQTITRLYGPTSGEQTSGYRLSSHSFQTLRDMLDGLQPPFIENDLARANWVVISIAGSRNDQPALVSRFLRERQDLLRDKRVILFAFCAPYYFDSTDISNLDAYFALYSAQPPFVDVAARLLFKELTPMGKSPVSIPAIGYDLIEAMTPDPNQVIALSLDLAVEPASTEVSGSPVPTPTHLYRIGDTITIRTGVIRDHNANPVPDGTVVRFSISLTGESPGILQQIDATTIQGVARASIGLDKPGLLVIRASSESATISNALQLDVSQSGSVAVTVLPPETTEEVTPIPATPTPMPEDPLINGEGYPRVNAWFLSMLAIVFSAALGYWMSARFMKRSATLRLALCVLFGGLVAYNYLALGLPGATSLLLSNGAPGMFGFVLLGELAGAVAGLLWARRG